MGALLVSRLLHPLGMYAAPNTQQFRIGRVGGITITFVLLIACRDDPVAGMDRRRTLMRNGLSHCDDSLFISFIRILTL
jgi:hypothetical protein